jgi:carbon monoxide dehydrogenase subunit G
MGEIRIEDEVVVATSPEAVWDAIKDPAVHAEWHPFVRQIRGEHDLGARRTCVVDLGKKTGETTELCIADDELRRIAWRIEEDSTGFLRFVTDWTAGFCLEPRDAGVTQVTAESAFRPRKAVFRLMTPIVRRKFHQAQQSILAALKRATEHRAASVGSSA